MWDYAQHAKDRRKAAIRFASLTGIVAAGCFGVVAFWPEDRIPKVSPRAVVQTVGDVTEDVVRGPDRYYKNCAAARADGRTNIPSWHKSYREELDADGDGWACEPYRH